VKRKRGKAGGRRNCEGCGRKKNMK